MFYDAGPRSLFDGGHKWPPPQPHKQKFEQRNNKLVGNFFSSQKSLRIFKKTFLEDYDRVSRFVSKGLEFWY
jgi:hypothetical protein